MKWYNKTALTLFLMVGAYSVFGQCYTGLRTEGLADFRQKQYKLAINNFFAARNCPDKPRGDDLDVLIKNVLTAWEEDLSQAVDLANQERDKALRATEIAKQQTQLALEQKEAAEHLAHASNNSALAIRTIRTNSTLAVRIAEFNYNRYPDNEAAAVAMRETLNSGIPFYKREINANKYVTSVAYLPDGNHFLIGRRGGIIENNIGGYRLELYDKEGNLIRSLISGENAAAIYGDVEDVAVSVEKDLVLTGSYSDSLAILTNLKGEILRVFKGHDASTVALSPDGKYALTGDSHAPARLWDTETGALAHVFEGHGSHDVLFSPDSKKVLIGDDEVVYLKNLDGSLIKELYGGDGFYMYPIHNCFSADGEEIAIGGSSPSLWTNEGEWIADLPVKQGYITAMAFTPDAAHVLGGTSMGEIYIWNGEGGVVHHFPGHNSEITSLAFSPDGKHFLTSGGGELNVKLWSWQNSVRQTYPKYADPVSEVIFHPNGQQVLGSYMSGGHRTWDINSGAYETDFQGPELYVSRATAFSSSGKYALTGNNEDSTAILWDRQTGEQLHTFFGHHSYVFSLFEVDTIYPATVVSVSFSADESQVLTAGSDRIVNLWDLKSKELITTISSGEDGINDMTFTPENDILFCTRDRTLKRYNQKGELLKEYKGHIDRIHCLAVSPDGQFIVSGGEKGRIIIHHRDGHIVHTITLPEEWIHDLTFSPDGKYFLSCSDDKARLWDLNGSEIQEFDGHSYIVQSGAFSPDGRLVVTGDYEGDIRIWPTKGLILEEQVAPISFGELLKVGLSTSKEDFFDIAKKTTDRLEVYQIYKQSKKLGLNIDLVDIVLAKETTPEGINAYIDIIDADFSAYTRENMELILKILKGDYSDLLSTYNTIYRLIEIVLPLEKDQENYPKYAMHINSYAWGQLMTGDFSGAESSLEKGLELDASNVYLQGNMPHVLLLQGAYEEAKQMYLKYAPHPFSANDVNSNFAEAFISDFNKFEHAGLLSENQQQQIVEIKELLSQYKKE